MDSIAHELLIRSSVCLLNIEYGETIRSLVIKWIAMSTYDDTKLFYRIRVKFSSYTRVFWGGGDLGFGNKDKHTLPLLRYRIDDMINCNFMEY